MIGMTCHDRHRRHPRGTMITIRMLNHEGRKVAVVDDPLPLSEAQLDNLTDQLVDLLAADVDRIAAVPATAKALGVRFAFEVVS